MASGRIIVPGWFPALDSDGAPIPNAQAFVYQEGTTTLATVYADDGLSIPLQNPVLANSAGRFPAIWADDSLFFDVAMDAPYGPPGQPFTFRHLSPSQDAAILILDATEDAATAAAESAASAAQSEIDSASILASVQALVAGASGIIVDLNKVTNVLTLALGALTPIPLTQDTVIVGRYDSSSQYAPARYKRVSALPTHALKFTDLLGGFWAIAEAIIDIRMAGGPVSSDALAPLARPDAGPAILRAYQAGDVLIPNNGPYNIATSVLLNVAGRAIRGAPGSRLTTSVNIVAQQTTPGAQVAVFQVQANALEFDSLFCDGTPCISYTAYKDCSSWIEVANQSSVLPGIRRHWDDLHVHDCFFRGGAGGMSVRGVERCRVERNVFEWQINEGFSLAGDTNFIWFENNLVQYVGCQAGSGSGGTRFGASDGANFKYGVFRNNVIRWNGYYTTSNFASVQSGSDFAIQSCEGLEISGNTWDSNGGNMEIKKSTGVNSTDQSKNITIRGNRSISRYAGITHCTARYSANTSVANGPNYDLKTVSIHGNDYINEGPSRRGYLGTNAISVIAGSRLVTVTLPYASTWATEAEAFKMWNTGDIGGISARELMVERRISPLGATQVTFEVETPATTTATGGTGAHFVGVFKTAQPVTVNVTSGSSTATVTLVGHNAPVGALVDMSRFATSAGVASTLLNRTVEIGSTPTADTFTFLLPMSATSTTSYSGYARVRLCAGEAGVYINTWHNAGPDACHFFDLADECVLLVGTVANGAQVEVPFEYPMVTNNVAHNCGKAVSFGAGRTRRAYVVGNTGYFRDSAMLTATSSPTENALIANNTWESRYGATGTVGVIEGGSLINCTFLNNVLNIDRGHGVLVTAATSGSAESVGNVFEGNKIYIGDVQNPGVGSFNLTNVRIDAGTLWAFRMNTMMSPTSAISPFTGTALANVVSTMNLRGSTANAAASLLTVAGNKGDYFTAENPAAGYTQQVCTASGSPTATWAAA